MDERDLEAYGRDYTITAPVAAHADYGIRSGDRYIAERDLLRAVAVAGSGALADVQLGVDPGSFYCADQMANLIALAGDGRLAGVVTGFIHVPPDRETSAVAAKAIHLHARADSFEHCARVLATAVRGVEAAENMTILITAFGPFAGVEDNPTAAFVADRRWLGRVVQLAFPGARGGVGGKFEIPSGTLRLVTAVLPLAASTADALAGRYFAPDVTAENFRRVLAEHTSLSAIISLGVDSGQIVGVARPAFKIETQTRGFHRGAVRGRTATDGFQRTLALARIFMRARAGDEEPLLRYRY